MSGEDDRAARYLARMEAEFPGLRVVRKADSSLSRVIDVALRVVTLGMQREYMTRYTTVLGHTIYTPEIWETQGELDRYLTLRHEAVHLRQLRRYGFVVMSFLYAVPFFPLGLAYGRARIEWEAYAETLRAVAEVKGIAGASDPALRERIVRQFVGPAYGWMWPFRAQVEGWIDDELARIRGGAMPDAR